MRRQVPTAAKLAAIARKAGTTIRLAPRDGLLRIPVGGIAILGLAGFCSIRRFATLFRGGTVLLRPSVDTIETIGELRLECFDLLLACAAFPAAH